MPVESLHSSYNAKGFRIQTIGVSGRDGSGLHVASRQQFREFAGLVHLADDVATADKFALDIELRHRRPVRERLDALAQRRIAQHVDTLELDTQTAQHLDHQAGKTALREDRRALHEQHHIVFADLALDLLSYWITHRLPLLSIAAYLAEASPNLSCHCEERSDEAISKSQSVLFPSRLLRFARNDDQPETAISASASQGSSPRRHVAGLCRRKFRRRRRRWASRRCRARPSAPCRGARSRACS